MSAYPVYLVESLGMPRNHHAIFVETQDNGSGTLFNVIGDIQSGMTYETRHMSEKPEVSNPTFISKSSLGWVGVNDLSRVDSVCRANPAPANQFDGPKQIDKNKPLRRCQEWTSETIGNLKAEGILLDNNGDSVASVGRS